MKKTASISSPVNYVDRKTGAVCTESVMGDGMLRFAYETALGHTLWSLLFHSGAISRLMGRFYDSPLSRRSLKSFVQIPGLDAQEAEKPLEQYQSFNEFFTRKLKPGSRPQKEGSDILISPADGRILVFPRCPADGPIPVKGAERTLEQLCHEKLSEGEYAVAVIRLAPVDYHRYHFPCACVQRGMGEMIPGKYHSVNPVALRREPNLFVENTRRITKLDSKIFGEFFYLEIGAFGVGSIVPTAGTGNHHKGEEKGFFRFGGSTVILILQANRVQFDDDLVKNSANGMETRIRCGEQIASAIL